MADKKLVVVQLTGGNDYLNCVIPYNDPYYVDSRPNVRITQDKVLPIDHELGMNPAMAPIKELYDQDKVAILHGVGYPVPSRSHFRSMDIWHTAEPDTLGVEGWLGNTINQMYPNKDNVVAAVNFGTNLPRALVAPRAPVATVADLNNYGLMNYVPESERNDILTAFKNMYSPSIGHGLVMDYLTQTGLNALKSTEILTTVMEKYESNIEYSNNPFARSIKGASAVLQAGIGTRLCYTQHGSFDAHTNGISLQEGLLTDISNGIYDFYSDLKQADKSDDVILFVFSEFGRRIKDNGNGTDHGAGGVAFVIGDAVEGGQYGEYPSLHPNKRENGEDLKFNLDFRKVYTEILEGWLGVEAKPIVKGEYETVGFLKKQSV